MPVKESGFWSFQSPTFCNPSPFAVSSKGHLKSLVTFEGIAKKVRMIFFPPQSFFPISQTHTAVLEWKGTEEPEFTAYIPVC